MSVTQHSAEAGVDQPGVGVVVDGIAVRAEPGELVIDAAERAGVYIPRFCYHPRMEPVGMCRMCLVEASGPRGFSLQPACFLRVQDGLEVRTQSPAARKAQEGVLEFLLVNHPLDCPVCDKGGECPLQDQAMSHGPGESRFVEEKRHWAKPIDIGPLIALDRERCIQCARCTRFSAEIAGDPMIDFAFRGDRIEVAPFPSEPFTSYFSGNTVQICPVGALTARPYRFKARPWDLEQVESTCTTCAVGCRFVAQSSAGELVRYIGVDSDPVNQSWLCDKGRFGYEWVVSSQRLAQPLITASNGLQPTSWNQALDTVARKLREVLETRGPEAIGVIGGAHLTNEESFAWAKFAKGVLGTDSVDAQLGDGLPADLVLGLPRATIDEAAAARVLVLMSADVREELPVLYLRLAAAARAGSIVIECSPVETALSALATVRLAYLPGDIARLGRALATGDDSDLTGIDATDIARARELLGADGGEGVVVVLGRPTVAESEEAVADGAVALHRSFPHARFLSALRRSNVHGALEMGLAPGVLPGRVPLADGGVLRDGGWDNLPSSTGRDTRAILAAAGAGELGALILLGSDPLGEFPDRGLAEEAFIVPPFIVALGTHPDVSNQRADVVLPIAGDCEREGWTTNLEGRVTRVAAKVVAPGVSWPAWVVAHELGRRMGSDLGFENLEAIRAEIDAVAPSQRGVVSALSAPAGADGVVIPMRGRAVAIGPARPLDPMATPGIGAVDEQGAPMRIGRAEPAGGQAPPISPPALAPVALSPERATGAPVAAGRLDAYSLRLFAARRLYDRDRYLALSPSLSPLSPEPRLFVHPGELERLGLPSGSRLRVRSARGELTIMAFGDESLQRQVALLEGVLSVEHGLSAHRLIDADAHGTDVRLETI